MDTTYKALDSVYDITIGSLVEVNDVRGMVIKLEVEAPKGQASWPTVTIQTWEDEQWVVTVIRADANTVAKKAVA